MRLTVFSKKDNAYLTAENIANCKPIRPEAQKLGKLEDIEEELGVDLITLVKAIKEGIYIKNDKDEIVDVSNEPCVLNAYVPTGDWGFEIWGQCPINFRETFTDLFRFKDYGITWALTREELE